MDVLTIKMVSKKLNTPKGTIRQWEKDFQLDTKRDAYGSRVYTKKELEILQFIKMQRKNNVSKTMIAKLLRGKEFRAESNELSKYTFKELIKELGKRERIKSATEEEMRLLYTIVLEADTIRKI